MLKIIDKFWLTPTILYIQTEKFELTLEYYSGSDEPDDPPEWIFNLTPPVENLTGKERNELIELYDRMDKPSSD